MPALSPAAARIRPGVFSVLEGRVAAYLRGGGDLVPLHIGDTYLPPPERAKLTTVLAERDPANEASLYRYGPTAGEPALKEALAAEGRDIGWADCEGGRHVHVGVGGTHALFCAARALLDNGDEVVTLAPYWPLAPGIFGACGATSVEVVTRPQGVPDARGLAARLAAAITPRTRAIYFVSPNNPDGSVLRRDELEAIAEIAEARDLWVFADEVYRGFVFDGREHLSIASFPGFTARTVVVGSFSKSHALAGARVGYVFAPEDVVLAMRRISTHSAFNVPLLSQEAARAALLHGKTWGKEACARYAEARDAATNALDGSGIEARPAEGATYLFLNLAPVLAGRTTEDLLGQAIERGVFLTPGAAFGPSFASYARLCFTAAPVERVLLGIERLRAAASSTAED